MNGAAPAFRRRKLEKMVQYLLMKILRALVTVTVDCFSAFRVLAAVGDPGDPLSLGGSAPEAFEAFKAKLG